ncbi:sulfotransferase family protein [Thiocystis minor]|uniref:sulfotransferase n=1 Tax=Thiocystis minor TaxID=61597 RepID=UPI0019131AC1|nr:sulfotransferase [Thiocystis minor]MBK5965073.1 sulfotransferase family protein [Thiocystis minor]
MLRLFLASTARLAALTYRTFLPPAGTGRRSPRRLLIMTGFIPLFALIQGIHWLGFLLDEIFFPGYRRVTIREPLFVLGVPRSGTTHLHRVLAADDQFTTFSTWECLFALSVTERRFWLGLSRLDKFVGRPLGHLLDWLEKRAFNAMQDVHSMRLRDPEEDYFALMPVLACFILILPFPDSTLLWRMGAFDRDMPAADRQCLMDFYRRCLQKHLYVHGTHKRLLSKNAAFAPLAGSLAAHFPDARFAICLREPEQTIPSQLSSIEPGIRFFDARTIVPDVSRRLTQQLGFYYANLLRAFLGMPDNRCAWVTMRILKADLTDTMTRLYGQLGLPLTTDVQSRLSQQGADARHYRSSHRYSAEQFGLSSETIEQELGDLYRTLASRAIRIGDAPPSLGSGANTINPAALFSASSQRPAPTTEPAPSC